MGELSAINGQICDFVRLIFDRKFGHFSTLFWPLFLMISSLGPSRVGSGCSIGNRLTITMSTQKCEKVIQDQL